MRDLAPARAKTSAGLREAFWSESWAWKRTPPLVTLEQSQVFPSQCQRQNLAFKGLLLDSQKNAGAAGTNFLGDGHSAAVRLRSLREALGRAASPGVGVSDAVASRQTFPD